MKTAFSEALNVALEDPRVLLLTGDHGYALFEALRRDHPDRYVNAGIAEQNMIGVAAGLAKAGLRPIVYALSAFMPIRVLEQIKLDICYENLPVVMVGDGAGVVYSSLGPSHQTGEDIAALRGVPNITVLSPADAAEMAECMRLALELQSPVYLRVGKAALGAVHKTRPRIAPGAVLNVRKGRGALSWIATGSMVHTALRAAENWPDSSVWSAPCIKPLDIETVAQICGKSMTVVVVEEHSIYGGLGSAVGEIAAERAPTRVLRIGIEDRFSARCGSYDYLMIEHRLTVADVTRKVNDYLGTFDTELLEPLTLTPERELPEAPRKAA